MGAIRDLAGQRYGRLVVSAKAEAVIRGHAAYWPCQCDCGAEVLVRGTKLTGHGTVSCGCERADPAVRQAARLKVSPRRRRQIARMGAQALIAARAAGGRK